MFFSTTETAAENIKIKNILGVVEYTSVIKISAQGLFDVIKGFNKKSPELEAKNYLISEVHALGGNALIGLRVDTAIANFSNGTFLYKTYIGTAALIEEVKPNHERTRA